MIRIGARMTKLVSHNLCILLANSKKALHHLRDGGCPLSGDLYVAKQSTKREYKRALKEYKLSRNRVHLERMNDYIENLNTQSF